MGPPRPLLRRCSCRASCAGRSADGSTRDGNEIEPLASTDVDHAAAVFDRGGRRRRRHRLLQQLRLTTARGEAADARSRRHWNGRWITRSSPLAPIMGEYERTSTAVVNAYVAPRPSATCAALDGGCARSACAADAADPEQRRRGLGRPGRRAAGDAAPVRAGRRRRRARLTTRRRSAREQPDLDGDRRHQLRRAPDERGDDRRTPICSNRRLPRGHALGRRPQHRRRRRHDRRGRPAGMLSVGPRGRRRGARPRLLRTAAAPRPRSPTRSSCSAGCGPADLCGRKVLRIDAALRREAIRARVAEPLGLDDRGRRRRHRFA